MHSQDQPGMEIGKTVGDGDNATEETINIPPSALKGHYGRFGEREERETALLTDMLSVHENTTGPTILLDDGRTNYTERFLKSYWMANDESLDDVFQFEIPEVAPGLAPFSIEADVTAGLQRDEAIEDVIDTYHSTIERHFGEQRYRQAPTANGLTNSLIRAMFDKQYVRQHTSRDSPDTFSIGDLSDAVNALYEAINKNEEIPFSNVGNERVRRNILKIAEDSNDQHALRIADAVIDRLSVIQESAWLRKIFSNTNRKFDFRNRLSGNEVFVVTFEEPPDGKIDEIIGVIALSNLARGLRTHDECRCTEGHETPADCYTDTPRGSSSKPACREPWGDEHLITLIVNGSWKLPMTNSVRRFLWNDESEDDLCVGISTDLRQQLNTTEESVVCETVGALSTVLANQDTGSERVNEIMMNG